MTRPKIAIVFRGIGDIGGTNNTIGHHARELVRQGYDVDLIGEKIHKGGVTPDMGRGIRIRRLPLLTSMRWRYFARRADAWLKSHDYDFVAGHGHNVNQNVLSMHNCLHLTHEIIKGSKIRRSDHLAEIHEKIFAADTFSACVCNSRLMQADLAGRYNVSLDRLPVIYPGFSPSQFNREDKARYRDTVRAELGVSQFCLIGLVSSGDFVKRGLDILISAYAQLASSTRERTRLLVLGKQGGKSSFLEQARAAGVAHLMIFVDATREPERYFHALDICVHPARVEEFGQVVQEAMACGIPVLSTKRVGAMEMLENDHFQSLPDTPTAEDLSQRMSELIKSDSERRYLAEAAYARVKENTAQVNFTRHLELYRSHGMPMPPS